jgi:aquaporin related protein
MFLFMSFQGAQSALHSRTTVDGRNNLVTDNQTILYIALSFGMSLVVTAWAFFRCVACLPCADLIV